MLSYTFTHLYNIVGMGENEIIVFLKDQTSIRYDLDDYTFDWSPNAPNYRSIKHYMDDFVYSAIENEHDNISNHLLMGYCFLQNGGNYYLNVSYSESSFFGLVGNAEGTPTQNFVINGMRVTNPNIPNQDYLGHLGMLLGNDSVVQYYPNSLGFTLFRDYDYVIDRTTNNIFFDYRLSNDDTYYLPTVNDSYRSPLGMFDSYFSFTRTSNENYTIGFGYVPITEYNKGYNTGLQDGIALGQEQGFASGRERGYTEGYYQGLAEGGNLPAAGLSMVGNAIEGLTPIFNLEVLPHISLGTIISVPIIITLITIIFRISKG